MQLLSKLITAILLMSPLAGLAHGYWIEAEGSHKINASVTVKLFFGEYSTGERLSGEYLDKMKDIKVFVMIPGKGQQQLVMKQLASHWEGVFVPQTEGSYEINGINDVREVQDWRKHNLGIVRPIQYLKIIYQVGTAITKQSNPSMLSIVINSISSDKYELQVFKNDSAFGSAEVTVTHPAGWEKIFITDAAGKTIFSPIGKGLYLIDVEWVDKTPGLFKEKKYESVRYKFDLSLYHESE